MEKLITALQWNWSNERVKLNRHLEVKLGDKLARPLSQMVREGSDSELYDVKEVPNYAPPGGAELKMPKLQVKQYFKPAWQLFYGARDVNMVIQKKPGLDKFFVPLIAVNEEKLQLVYERPDCSLDRVYVDIRSSKQQLLSPVAKAWILYDLARAIKELSRPVNIPGHQQAVFVHNNIKSEKIMLMPGWENRVKELKVRKKEDLASLPPLALLSEMDTAKSMSGQGTTANPWQGHFGEGDKNYQAPEEQEGKQGSPAADVWRWGLVAWELMCNADWHEGTLEDQCRITRHRLKPHSAEGSPITRAYTGIWQAGQNGAPGVIYDILHFGCWQTQPGNRPSPDMLVKIAEYHLQDTLIAAGKLELDPEAKDNRPKPNSPNYVDEVFRYLGYTPPDPPPPPSSKRKECCCYELTLQRAQYLQEQANRRP